MARLLEIVSLFWTNWIQMVESLNESNAVLPNSTETTPTRPGRTSTVSRFASGLRTTSRPGPSDPSTARRPQTDSLPTSVE